MTIRRRTKGPTQTTGVYKHCYLDGRTHSSTVQVLASDEEFMEDNVVPNYHRRIANGEIINNPCLYTRTRWNSGGGYLRSASVSTPSWGYETCDDSTGSLSMWQANRCGLSWSNTYKPTNVESIARNDARAKALGNIDNTPYKFMEDAFELRETLRYLRNPLGAVKNLAKSFRKDVKAHRKFKHDHTKAIADVWLSYQFGFSPLMRSAMDALEVANNGLYARPVRRTARGFASHIDMKTPVDDEAVKYGIRFTQNQTTKTDVHAGIIYEVDSPLQSLRHTLGFRMKDIPETIWAVMPYSFMVDRVVNISQYIRGVTNLLDPNVKILAGFVTTRTDANVKTFQSGLDNPNYTLTLEPDVIDYTKYSYQREVWVPSFGDALPPSDLENLVSDARKVLDLSSLIRIRLKF